MIEIKEVTRYSQSLKLLYVEDDIDAREITTMLLEDFFDTIIVAENGQEGLEKFQKERVDIVITDINMPHMNGLEMAKKIRAIDIEVPIIILSAHNEEDFFLKSIQIGINGYLLKPIDMKQLSSTIFQVTQRYKYALQAKQNLHLLKEYQEATNNSAIVSKTDTAGIITYVNDAFCETSGYTKEELLGQNHNIIRHPDNPKSIFQEMWDTIKNKKKMWKGIIRNRTKNGKSYYVDSVVKPIRDLDGNILEYISLRHNITDIMHPLKQLKNELKNAHDPLLVYIKLEDYDDLEDFYDTNTLYILEQKARIYLQNTFAKKYSFDKIYQLQNGEYAFILDAKEHTDNITLFVQELQALQQQVRDDTIAFEDLEYDISILLTFAYENDKLYESVKLGMKKLVKEKQRFLLANNFASQEQRKAKENIKTVHMIKDAIRSSRIISYFQPIVNNNTQTIEKYESLVRLIKEDGTVLSPYFFLETAKRSNYYLKITNIVLEHSFSILHHCEADISINLSALDIEMLSMRTKILSLLEQYKNEAHRVVFELLEDEGIKDFETVKQFISEIKRYGVKIAIDDFGAGYSNFERLLDYQPDILKIDGCLIRDIETSNYSLSAVKSIVTFAKEQKLQTVAEFIENEAIFQIVKELGIDFSQGYYFGKPEPLS
ncbi:EAL domain-containing protein [Sulfurimonas sp. SWIR-19]|uniref:EAL domain-containing response regulator n=1 Tax=Sulfurimonas sp. SWIR-19 TaxID=2878390 RepID=UPI001CF4800E|nr:EAL domain-containing protein [Sulfurimonas sp. SWIR-19]UCN00246.1 EAL domain-containing protein [Sulfurimonas sp. SWIR-19]